MEQALQHLKNLAVSEIRAVGEIANFALRTQDPEVILGFMMMLADEARHSKTLVETVQNLGGSIDPLPPEELALLNQGLSDGPATDLELARFLGRIAQVEEDLPRLMKRVVAEIDDPALRETVAGRLSYIAQDETRHSRWASEQLDRLVEGEHGEAVREALSTMPGESTGTRWRYAYCR